jgi:hypothetical protein
VVGEGEKAVWGVVFGGRGVYFECGVWRTVVLSRVDADGVERTALNPVSQVVIVVLHWIELYQWPSGAAGQLPLCVRVVDAR